MAFALKISYPANRISIFCTLIFALIFLSTCQVKEECIKFIGEEYSDVPIDSNLLVNEFEYKNTLLKRFGETPIKDLSYSAYHLQFFSSLGFGQSIKFEKKNYGYVLSVKCVAKEAYPMDCNEYQTIIDEEDWNELEEMIYEFNFWTSQQFKKNKKRALDGSTYCLEGNRPEAVNCDKKTYQFIIRDSPQYDKIGALCNHIMKYEFHLAQKYKTRRLDTMSE
jgi:hypothetical protein